MTKYEWERELKQHLKDLPESEKQRISEYFDELFEDKFESGMNEYEIIAEFGEPEEAARKIGAEFSQEQKFVSEPFKSANVRPDNNNATNAGAASFNFNDAAEIKPEELTSVEKGGNKKKKGGRNPLSIFFKIIAYILFFAIFGTIFIALIITAISIAFSVIATGFGLAVGGVSGVIISIIYAIEVGKSWVAVLGMGVLILGLGLIILATSKFVVKATIVLSKFLFKGIGGMFAKRKEISK